MSNTGEGASAIVVEGLEPIIVEGGGGITWGQVIFLAIVIIAAFLVDNWLEVRREKKRGRSVPGEALPTSTNRLLITYRVHKGMDVVWNHMYIHELDSGEISYQDIVVQAKQRVGLDQDDDEHTIEVTGAVSI